MTFTKDGKKLTAKNEIQAMALKNKGWKEAGPSRPASPGTKSQGR